MPHDFGVVQNKFFPLHGSPRRGVMLGRVELNPASARRGRSCLFVHRHNSYLLSCCKMASMGSIGGVVILFEPNRNMEAFRD